MLTRRTLVGAAALMLAAGPAFAQDWKASIPS